jgi:hypothetical protein
MIPLDKPFAPRSPLSREAVRVNSADNINIARPKLKGDTDSNWLAKWQTLFA